MRPAEPPTMVASTDGVQVALHDLGGDGPPLVVLHATGFHGLCYRAIADHLGATFRVWAPDLRGHGDALTPELAALPWQGMAEDVLAVVDHVASRGPAADGAAVRFFGHSMGGAAAVLAELARPGTMAGAWLFEPIIFPLDAPDPGAAAAPAPENPLSAMARRRRAGFSSRSEAFERYAGRDLFAAVEPAVLQDYVDHGFRDTTDGVTLKCAPETEAAVFEGSTHDTFSRLDAVDAPITVVASGDGGPPATVAPAVAAALPHGALTTWADRTHFGPFEDPARAADEIRAALR